MRKPYRLTDGKEARDYQLRASHKIFLGSDGDGTAVIIDMGLGKTFMVLDAINALFQFGIISKPVLLVAPIIVAETVWMQEAAIWSNTNKLTFSLLRGNKAQRQYALKQPAHIYLVNPELLDWLHKELRGDWSAFDMLVLDDIPLKDPRTKRFKLLTNYGDRHTIKGPDGKSIKITGKSVPVGPHRFVRTAILTGTPAPTSLLNLWCPFYVLDHGKRLHGQFQTYRDRYFFKQGQVADHVYRYGISEEEFEVRPDWMPKDGAPVKIHENVADISVELNGEDYGVLPPTIGDASKGPVPATHMHYIQLPPAERELYDRMEKEALIELNNDFIMAVHGGARTQLCHQICNGFVYRTDEFGTQHTEQLHNLKLDKLEELLDRINSNVVITYNFVADRQRLMHRLQSTGRDFAVLTSKNAVKVLDRWNKGEISNMLLHPFSASHGINAQLGGNNIIWYSQIWSLEKYMQTNARLARSGQPHVVGIHHIAGEKTVDELMIGMYRQRGSDQARFRSALRQYQQLRGWGIGSTVLEDIL